MNSNEVDSDLEPQRVLTANHRGWICDKIIDTVGQIVPFLSTPDAIPLGDSKQNLKDASGVSQSSHKPFELKM